MVCVKISVHRHLESSYIPDFLMVVAVPTVGLRFCFISIHSDTLIKAMLFSELLMLRN